MVPNKTMLSNTAHLKLCLFSSASAISIFLEMVTIGNWFSIQYFFHTARMTIRIDFLSTLGDTLLWIASFFIVYTLIKEIAEKTSRFRQVHLSLNVALIGSFFLLFSILLGTVNPSAGPPTNLLIVIIGYTLSFGGSSIALFTIMAQNKNLQKLFLIYLFSLVIPIEMWSLIHWVAYPFDVVANLGFAWRGAFIELQLFYLIYPTIFWLLIAFLFSWIWMPLINYTSNRIMRAHEIYLKAFLFGPQKNIKSERGFAHENPDCKAGIAPEPSKSRFVPTVVLLASLFLGVFIAYYPYIHPNSGLVGHDAPRYYLSLTGMVNKDFYSAVQFTTTTDRPLYFLMLYFLKNLTQLPSNSIVELVPIITVLANTLAVFWFVKVGEKKALLASSAALLNIFSFNTTIAMHSGIFANWFAMALGFAIFGLMLEFQERKSRKLFFMALLAWASVFFTHYWTGMFFLLVFVCYLFLTLLESRSRSPRARASVVVLVLFASAIVITLLSSNFVPRFFASFWSTENVGLTEVFTLFWKRLPIFIDSWFYGALANPIMISLALIGIIVCFRKKTNFSRLLISWTFVGSILTVAVSPIGEFMDQWLMWRTLYLVPFQIPATLGLFYLVSKLGFLPHETNPQQNCGNKTHVNSVPGFLRNRDFVISYLLIGYLASAVLLILNLPILIALIFSSHLILTLVFHFKISKGNLNSTLVFIFILFVMLLLLNYTLRSLAPLTVSRMQY